MSIAEANPRARQTASQHGEWAEKVLCAVLGGLIAFSGTYMAVVAKYVTRDQVSAMIQVESPYKEDQKWIESQLITMSSGLVRVERKLDQLLRQNDTSSDE